MNAVRTILAVLPFAAWKADMPRLIQGALARQKEGRWDLTLANAWGVLAMEKFSKVYEAVPVAGATRSVLGEKTETLDWNASPRGKVESFPWPGKGQDLAVTHVGSGRPWVAIQSLAAIPRKEPFSSGYKIKKTVIPVEKKNPNGWTRGDILRIRLEVEAQADQTWVVVSDPIPAGSTILGTGARKGFGAPHARGREEEKCTGGIRRAVVRGIPRLF